MEISALAMDPVALAKATLAVDSTPFFVGFAQCLQFIEIFSLFYLHFKRVQFGIRPRQSCVMSKATCFLLTPERNKTLLNEPHM